MTNKHYVVLPNYDADGKDQGGFKVVCLAHAVASNLKQLEAEALANAMNLQSCHEQEGFGSEDCSGSYMGTGSAYQ